MGLSSAVIQLEICISLVSLYLLSREGGSEGERYERISRSWSVQAASAPAVLDDVRLQVLTVYRDTLHVFLKRNDLMPWSDMARYVYTPPPYPASLSKFCQCSVLQSFVYSLCHQI